MLSAKVPAALFITAGLIGGVALLQGGPSPAGTEAPLPDPVEMRANGYGYQPLEDTVELWQGRVEENPADRLSRVQLGQSLLGLARESGDLTLYERAERQLRIAAGDAPTDPSAQAGLAAALAAQHEFSAALDLLTRVQAERPDDDNLLAAVADAHLDLGDYDEAFAAVDELVDRLPPNPATLSRQARVAALTGRNDKAVEDAEEALRLSAAIGLRPSAAASMWFQLAFFQYQAGEVDDAESSVRSALTVDDGHLPSRELLGRVLVAQGGLDDAAALYEDLLATSPAADLHGLLAEVYEAQGRSEEADEQVELGLALAEEQVGRFPAERRHLAGFFADHDPVRFLELAEQDVAARRDVYGLDLLAWAQHLNGDTAAARETMEEALALGTEDAPLLYHAGMIEAAAGNDGDARDLLTRALDLNPGFDIGDVRLAVGTLASL
jgi:tetratricopeptide (TPR) repeat protein